MNFMKKFIWLYLSSFGIMFAVLSWVQDGGARVSWAQFYMPWLQGRCNNFTNLARINQS